MNDVDVYVVVEVDGLVKILYVVDFVNDGDSDIVMWVEKINCYMIGMVVYKLCKW